MKITGVRRFAFAAAAFVFPFLYFFRHVYPNSALLVLGNDFAPGYYSYKAFLAESLAKGVFPLWSPTEVAGYPFYANPLSAALYPLNVLPVLLFKIFGQYNQGFHQVFSVLGVALFGLGTYLWLSDPKGRRGEPASALFAAVATSSSWYLASYLRFPNALHATAWLPWALWMTDRVFSGGGRGPAALGAFFIALQITAGYPYIVVYSYIFYAGYVLFRWVEPSPNVRLGAGLGARLATLFSAPVLLAFPYLAAVKNLMARTSDRAGGNFSFATDYSYGPVDLLSSFLFPPLSSPEGWVYLGVFPAFLLAWYFWQSQDHRERTAVLAGGLLTATLMFGWRSWPFTFVWSFTPVVHQMRVFGRMAVLFLPLAAIALERGYRLFEGVLFGPERERRSALGPALGMLGVLLGLQGLLFWMTETLPSGIFEHYLPEVLIPCAEVDFLIYGFMTALIVIALLRTDLTALRWGKAWLLGGTLLLCTMDAGNAGRFLWSHPFKAALARHPEVKVPEAAAGLSSVGSVLAAGGAAHRAFQPLFENYFTLGRDTSAEGLTPRELTSKPIAMDANHFAAYRAFYNSVSADPVWMKGLFGEKKLFFHSRMTYKDPGEFLKDSARKEGAASISVGGFDANRLELEATVLEPGYLTWIDNDDPGWRARLDGAPVGHGALFGVFKTVRIDLPGKHRVEFRYRPDAPPWSYAAPFLGLALLAAF